MISAGFGALPIRPNVFTRLFASIRLCLCSVIISNSIYISGLEQVTIAPISICVWGLFVLVVVDGCFVYLFITEALVAVHLNSLLHTDVMRLEKASFFSETSLFLICVCVREGEMWLWDVHYQRNKVSLIENHNGATLRLYPWTPSVLNSYSKGSWKVKWWHHSNSRYFLWQYVQVMENAQGQTGNESVGQVCKTLYFDVSVLVEWPFYWNTSYTWRWQWLLWRHFVQREVWWFIFPLTLLHSLTHTMFVAQKIISWSFQPFCEW